MDKTRLVNSLASIVGEVLASELVTEFLKIRQDYATKTLERASPGKFVETFVQCLQFMDKGSYEPCPAVDRYLNTVENTNLTDGLRICASRIARSIYTLRNKRSIAHKNSIDPNGFDLAYIHQASVWVMSELVRNATELTMHESGTLITLLQAPVEGFVERINGKTLIQAGNSIQVELLILLHSHYPCEVSLESILDSLNHRQEGSVRNRLRILEKEKLIYGTPQPHQGYRLTQWGHAAARAEIERISVS